MRKIHKLKIISLGIIFSFLIPTFLLIPTTYACKPYDDNDFKNISVRTAYRMIKKYEKCSRLLILDVRNSEDFDSGHLFNAINIPFDELETRLHELEDFKESKIIIYCNTGITSELASTLMASNGFKRIYNMLGGIQAWMDAGYIISTTFHYITVTRLWKHKIFLNIKPLIGHEFYCSECNGDTGDSDFIEPENVELSVLVENDTHLVLLQTFELEGVYYETIITYIIRWIYLSISSNLNRTAWFFTTEIEGEGFFISYDSIIYLAEYENYALGVYSQFVPFDFELYSHSFTYVLFMTSEEDIVLSEEFVEINLPLSMSELYSVLAIVSLKMYKTYKKYSMKSGDPLFSKLANGYKIMREECHELSKIIRKFFPEFDIEILQSYAILSDPPWWVCLGASFVCGFLVGYLVTCAILAIPTAGASLAACIGSALAAVGAGWALLSTCTIFCCCMGYSVCC